MKANQITKSRSPKRDPEFSPLATQTHIMQACLMLEQFTPHVLYL